MTDRFLPRPDVGRVYTGRRTVRMGDVTPGGRLRLDALARYLGDVGEDDVADSGWDEPVGWVLRRCTVLVDRLPVLGQSLELDTFCSGTAPRWAERTTTVGDADGPALQARALWVAVDLDRGRPLRLGPDFADLYGPAAAGRQAIAKLSLPGPPAGVESAPWPLRAVDLDLWGHANNAVHWAAVEEVLAGSGRVPADVLLEYHEPALPGGATRLAQRAEGEDLLLWLLDGDRRLATGRIRGERPGRAGSAPTPPSRPGG